MTTTKYPRGSEWRKWDLHLHTASSFDYKYNSGDADKKLIDTLISNNISVIAITDHFVIDKKRITDLKELASAMSYDLVVFPGVELRTDKGGSNIHPIIIFDNSIDLNVLTEDFNVFKRSKAIDKEDNQTIRWDFKDIVDFSKDHNGIITIHAGSKKNGIDEQISNVLPVKIATKDEYAKTVDILEIGKLEDIDEYKTYKFHRTGIKPMVMGSDNHNPNKYPNEHNSQLYTWIKADPTFEGLKQIIYEPEERVRIQYEDPTFDREKYPFTNIKIPTQTKVFAEEDDIYFESSDIPLNNNLVSIIGGRGTGKSQLINYLAATFNRGKQSKYNLSTDIEVSRKASITEDPICFKVKDSPNVPFMYIAQSQIKELVEHKEDFSRNILETIGVTDAYRPSFDYSELAETTINEYHRIIKVLNADEKTSKERKESINKEIKRYSDFIQNITSEQNKKKLEGYKNKVEKLHGIKSWQEKVNQLYEKNNAFANETNAILQKWNEQLVKLGISIPLVDIQSTQDSLNKILLPRLLDAFKKTECEIENTKKEFKDYKGDLTTLLSNVSLYQNKLSELIKQKEAFEQEERKYQTISSDSFKELGNKIRKSIEDYTELIKNKWTEFKGENDSIDPKKKELLNIILQKDLDVEAVVTIDTEKMYNLLLDKLDGRSYNLEKLEKLIGIETVDDFYKFVCQETSEHVFSSQIREDLRKQILYLFYKQYTKFISIGVGVSLNKKPITKLSFGQQGTIYLRLQIAANMFSETIIYDQPEDDLDNDFITNELIPIFKKIKLYRQVIIVSHNANLVVNADSEQVIIAKNVDGKLSYSSGSLEDPEINAEVCRILEGGKTAFEDRERKYKF